MSNKTTGTCNFFTWRAPTTTHLTPLATRLAPNEVHFGRFPRLSLTVIHNPNMGGHQSLNRDQLGHMTSSTDRQRRACRVLRALHAITLSRLDRRNASFLDALRPISAVFRR